MAEYLYDCMEAYNPDAFNSAPVQWKKLWSGDIEKLLAKYIKEHVAGIILESQSNPKFRKYVVRGQGLVDMADRIHAHLVEHGPYQPQASAADADHAADQQVGIANPASNFDDEDFPVSYHPDVQYLADSWKRRFHSDIDLAQVREWLDSWSSNDLLRCFRFVATEPDWKKAILDADTFDWHIALIMDASDPDTPDCTPPPGHESRGAEPPAVDDEDF